MDIINIEDVETGVRPSKNSTSIQCNCIHSNSVCYIVVTIATLALLGAIVFICRDYIKVLLYWIEHQNIWIVTVIFIALFTVVSFPIVIGYLFLIIASGYLFGILRGIVMVVLSANLGIAIAHVTLSALSSKLPIGALLQNDTARAILRVISGPQAFKVVLFARLTPIPFGLQNTIFAVSNMGGIRYHIASALGLLPAQIINIYLGSSLRSMQDVLEDRSTAATGYIVFCFQILIGISLMVYVLQKARRELQLALLEADLASMAETSHYLLDTLPDSKIVLTNLIA
ncbi:transmembrane protein 64 [Bombus vosnesenskii]|uniref:Transmembrane protein 64 n=3 Tax=Pyrobombus TaxID=144703 RepID=A0A6J3KPU3_9HYME|nr:transmembrane protein 64 [Bombus impatiens]XP_012241363.1 transmembrane protein 64 [Bombus impatiens]XP_033207014.1 transmembrane protein 64 [Bombus vancouverensis nearcticus]XP_033207015.1 transmembrane protein 64 [Bombus vancouverensis nearcticus]XP_033315774.1 transmembrane protein 64 [Bombus bifarius]XP_033315775.1 transmembrane protein 64 [Bombus bifarius]XP_033355065.1 transmembrane protein 64 [Bombus vosnesenskii]XP_033355066.1 transmembrane protein 64 [Bombus vosnesenskii]XP_0504